jgi:hypothetical protein
MRKIKIVIFSALMLLSLVFLTGCDEQIAYDCDGGVVSVVSDIAD